MVRHVSMNQSRPIQHVTLLTRFCACAVSPRSERAYKEITSQFEQWIEGLDNHRGDKGEAQVWWA